MREDLSRRSLLMALACQPAGLWAQPAMPSQPGEIAAELPGAKLLGSGRLTFFGLQIYDARLWVVDEFKAELFEQTPHAIELEYARTLYGKLIAERSLKEMKRSGSVSEAQGETWLAAMLQTFPDVAKGDRLTGVYRPKESARFFLNGKAHGEIRDAEFARRFFGIWLSPDTSEPKLRQSLLGSAFVPPRAGS